MSFANIYTHRKVADTAAKGCDVCYRSTTSVLVAPENKDFFFVCPSHLKDRNFCAPIIDTAAVEAKKKKEMDEELERVKKEYEERQRKKKEKEAQEKSEEKDKDKSSQTEDKKSTDKKDDDEDKACATLQRKRSKQLTCCRASPTPQLKCQKRSPGNFFALRIEKKRQIELAKRNRERIAQPNFFPSVPKGAPNSG
ncbi:5-methyltetrahydropteroyltriglutamate--homocysteine methyltransferase [Verticillium dahliae VDG1]|nr:5-methyltetrahydropteroyltriglutamate--homocysteine methyltransferase [Verticillium dahliae VDG1]